MPSFLDSYEPLDVIGNGSFGIIRKVKRKSDGMVRFLCFLGLN
jgi:NIMA (never in mitosis gene a)-related kinase 2